MTSKKNVMAEAALGKDVEKTPCGERTSAALPRPRLVLVGSTVALVRGFGGNRYDNFFMTNQPLS